MPERNQRRPEVRARPVRVAIIGGGCAGVAAAWQLYRLGYKVDVFEQSARLGGKGASQRDDQGRILEHGLHVWLGFYENAFKMVRDCYAVVEEKGWGPHSSEKLAHGTFLDAFFPEPHIGVSGRNSAGEPVVWSGHLPPAKGLPGDPLDLETNPFTIQNYLLRCIDLLKALMLSAVGAPANDKPGQSRPERRSSVDEQVDLDFSVDPIRSPEALIRRITERVRDGTLTVAAAVLQAVTIVETMLQDLNHNPQVIGSALNLLQALTGQARKLLRDFVSIDGDLRLKTEIIDIVMTIAVGLYRDRVLFPGKGLDALNDLDYREWLKKHGATKSALASPFITGIYDLVFAYEGGDRERPRLAAGVALRGALRMFFTYRGSMFWRMRSGMGDAVFAPLYKVMQMPGTRAAKPKPGGRNRKAKDGETITMQPVTFHFCHTLREVTLDELDNEPFVTGLRFEIPCNEVELDSNSADALDDFGCWPAGEQRILGQAGAGGKLERPLKQQDDFDAVIFALGIEDLKRMKCRVTGGSKISDFFARLPKEWLEMSRHVKTVATKSAQVWLDRDLEGLGWYRGPGVISALGLSFDTWADMTQTLPSEAWHRNDAGANRARTVGYFCGVLNDQDARKSPDAVEADIKADVDALLHHEMQHLWPDAFAGDGGRKKGRKAAAKRDATTLQVGNAHVQANTTGSDRYTLSLPGSLRTRISPLACPVRNATVAGDWTACGLDAGCVEAAVMSGMLAAHAITGKEPELDSIIGYDHP